MLANDIEKLRIILNTYATMENRSCKIEAERLQDKKILYNLGNSPAHNGLKLLDEIEKSSVRNLTSEKALDYFDEKVVEFINREFPKGLIIKDE